MLADMGCAHQLALQRPASTLADQDAMIALLGPHRAVAKVDGHDMGSGETDVFIDANALETTLEVDPARSWHQVP